MRRQAYSARKRSAESSPAHWRYEGSFVQPNGASVTFFPDQRVSLPRAPAAYAAFHISASRDQLLAREYRLETLRKLFSELVRLAWLIKSRFPLGYVEWQFFNRG